MTETEYIIATQIAAIDAAVGALQLHGTPGGAIPEDEHREVMRAFSRWRKSGYAALNIEEDDDG